VSSELETLKIELEAERARSQKLREALKTAQAQLEVCGDFFEFSRSMGTSLSKEHREFAKESAKNIEKALAKDGEEQK
jgi:molecular chaperone DnaK (HSP70)